MVEGSSFIYYGVMLNKNEAYDIARENRENSIYDVSMLNDLKCQYVGHDSYTSELVIGREIFSDYGKGFSQLDLNGEVEISTVEINEDNKATIPLNPNEEQEVLEKLKKIGIKGKPKYYFITSYNSL